MLRRGGHRPRSSALTIVICPRDFLTNCVALRAVRVVEFTRSAKLTFLGLHSVAAEQYSGLVRVDHLSLTRFPIQLWGRVVVVPLREL